MLDDLQEKMHELEREARHEGYWYSVSGALVILVCGMLCRLQTIDDIHEWSQAKPVRKFFQAEFGMTKIPCRAQFYNILKCVDAQKFNQAFIKWMAGVLQGKVARKTVCATDKLTKDGSVLHIASALVSEMNLVIGSVECVTKTGEITAFRELLGMLDVSGAIVVADALHCNKNSAEAVIDAGADYLFVVKDNVPTLKSDIELFIMKESFLRTPPWRKTAGA